MKRSATREVDVAVLGGGPAGTATALTIARLGHSAVIIERSNYHTVRFGETLPPGVHPLLARLGVWREFLAQNPCPTPGILSAWAQAELYANDFIFNPYGYGWHVDRVRFDAMLAEAVENAGVHLLREAQVVSIQERGGGGWRIEIRVEGERVEWEAQFLVDATGRASTVARKQGALRSSRDHLVGVVAFFTPGPRANASLRATLVEAVEDGWWYSARLPDFRMVVAYMTDADLYAQGLRTSRDYWNKQLRRTEHTKLRLRAWTPACVPRVVPANSSRLDRMAGKNWLAVGDAAMAFDPLSSQGVYKALEAGFQGAEAIHNRLSGDAVAFLKFASALGEYFDRYLTVRRYFYTKEWRWPDAVFWKRRSAAPSPTGPAPHSPTSG